MLETHITRATEIQNYIPNLTINGAFGVVNPQIFIRGVGNNDFNDNAGATVGVYQDEVYLSAPAGKLVQTYDLESVQVLRGPQGTLFGRNNTAGAIAFTSIRRRTYRYPTVVTASTCGPAAAPANSNRPSASV